MKNLIILFIVASVVFLFSCGSSEKDVPSNVKIEFAKLYPDVNDVDWEKEGENFEAKFEIADIENSVIFDATGNFLETETEINENELPAAVKAYLQNNYNGVTPEEAFIIRRVDAIFYEIEIEVNKKETELLFDESGNLQENTEVEIEDENEKDEDN
ncbi:MAG: PepSY-like domain-containing protein [Fimbriimonadaceae bacterium]|nr:PepSY-like domain-containing protein [Chitinophagales bacterium]